MERRLVLRLERLLAKLDKSLTRQEKRMARIADLLGDANQKLCHLIKRQRDILRNGESEDGE